jgi:predicted transcriptional regulator
VKSQDLVTSRINRVTVKQLEAIAKDKQTTRSAIISSLVEDFVKAQSVKSA